MVQRPGPVMGLLLHRWRRAGCALLGEDSAQRSLGLWTAAHPRPACQSPLLVAALLGWRPGQMSLIRGIYVIICLHRAELRKASVCLCFYSAVGRQNSQGEKQSRRPSEWPWIPRGPLQGPGSSLAQYRGQ